MPQRAPTGRCARERTRTRGLAMHGSTRKVTRGRVAAAILGLVALTAVDGGAAVVGSPARRDRPPYQGVWQLKADSAFSKASGKTTVAAKDLQAFSLNKANLRSMLAAAPASELGRRARHLAARPERQVPALRDQALADHGAGPRREASRHRDVQRPRARRRDGHDPCGHLADRLPCLGPVSARRLVHRSVLVSRTRASTRATTGARFPRTRTSSSSVTLSPADLSIDKGYYHASDTVTVNGSGFARTPRSRSRSPIRRASRPPARSARPSDGSGSFSASFVADPDGKLDDRVVSASDGESSAGNELPGRPRRRSDVGSADRRRPAPLPHRAHDRPGLLHLPRWPGQRHAGQGRAHEPRQPGLRGRSLDHAPADRADRPAEPEHVGGRDRPERSRAASRRATPRRT